MIGSLPFGPFAFGCIECCKEGEPELPTNCGCSMPLLLPIFNGVNGPPAIYFPADPDLPYEETPIIGSPPVPGLSVVYELFGTGNDGFDDYDWVINARDVSCSPRVEYWSRLTAVGGAYFLVAQYDDQLTSRLICEAGEPSRDIDMQSNEAPLNPLVWYPS